VSKFHNKPEILEQLQKVGAHFQADIQLIYTIALLLMQQKQIEKIVSLSKEPGNVSRTLEDFKAELFEFSLRLDRIEDFNAKQGRLISEYVNSQLLKELLDCFERLWKFKSAKELRAETLSLQIIN